MAGGRPVIVEAGTTKSRTAHKDWRAAVTAEAQRWQSENDAPLLTGPLGVSIHFYLEKPPSKQKWKIWPDVKPDIDKLTRSVFDSLTKVIWRDDALVCSLQASKTYGDPPRAEITVWELDEPH